MPTYEYVCTKCGYTFELFQSIKSKPTVKCPKCGEKSERIISGGAGLIFKGSGFYITDYKKKSDSKTNSDKKKKPIAKKDNRVVA